MRTDIPSALLTHLGSNALTTAICWVIEKNDGSFIRGTEHDQSIVISSGVYTGTYRAGANITATRVQSGSDLAPDNMDVNGAIPTLAADYIDIAVSDIEGGLLSHAAVEVFAVNWATPNDGQLTIRRGYLGEIARDSDGRYTTEIRGLLQQLSQVFVETYTDRCVVKRFGDARCKLDLTTLTHTGAVTAVTNRRAFGTNYSAMPYPEFRGAAFTFTSGPNGGFMREVKSSAAGAFLFWEPFPVDPVIGNTFSVTQGCDRTFTQCQAYDNVNNFRGYGLFIPGIDAIAKGPK